jgi:hypothetical protein
LQVMERSAEGVLLETGRLVLRQFTMFDVDNLVTLDADPDVMRFITGGLATSRDEITDSLLPGFMAWYRRPGRLWLLGGREEIHWGVPGMVPLPSPPGRAARGDCARVPASQAGMGTGLRHRGITRLGP